MMHSWNNIASSLKHQQSDKAMIEKRDLNFNNV